MKVYISNFMVCKRLINLQSLSAIMTVIAASERGRARMVSWQAAARCARTIEWFPIAPAYYGGLLRLQSVLAARMCGLRARSILSPLASR
jgi:hypothetical protein